jgi:hypothetical protein
VRYHIDKMFFGDNLLFLYQTFLIQTDYIPNKIVEAQALGTTLEEDYTEILQAREYAREQIRLLEVTNGQANFNTYK